MMLLADVSAFPVWELFQGPLGRWWLWFMLTFLAVMFFLHLAFQLRRLPLKRSQKNKHTSEAGTATIEFALVLPILLFLVMMLLQIMLALVGNMFVHYAAFNAVRSAIVYIPSESLATAEPNNGLWITSGVAGQNPGKMDAIARAAAVTMIPVSGQSDAISSEAQQYVQGVRRAYESDGQTIPNWVDRLLPGRYAYAMQNTQVRILRTTSELGSYDVQFEPVTPGMAMFGANEPITVEVEHRLNLSIPFVRAVFADGSHMTADGEVPYARIRAQSTLTNEGVAIALPEEPPIPRIP